MTNRRRTTSGIRLLLTAAFTLSAVFPASPAYALRGEQAKDTQVAAGLEEFLKDPASAVDRLSHLVAPPDSAGLEEGSAAGQQKIRSQEDDLSDFVFGDELTVLSRAGQAAVPVSEKSRGGISSRRQADLQRIVDLAQGRFDRYSGGERSVDVLPALPRRIVYLYSHLSMLLSPRISVKELEQFAQKHWDPAAKDIAQSSKESFGRKLRNPAQVALSRGIRAPTPEELEIAFRDLKAAIRRHKIVPKERTGVSKPGQPPGKLNRAEHDRIGHERSANLRAEWIRASRELVERLIRAAGQQGEARPIGAGTALDVQDSAPFIGSLDNIASLTLGDLKKRLKSNPVALIIEKPNGADPGAPAALKVVKAGTMNAPAAVQRRIRELDAFPDEQTQSKLFPSTGLEEESARARQSYFTALARASEGGLIPLAVLDEARIVFARALLKEEPDPRRAALRFDHIWVANASKVPRSFRFDDEMRKFETAIEAIAAKRKDTPGVAPSSVSGPRERIVDLEAVQRAVSWRELFGNDRAVVWEVGVGNGEALLWRAGISPNLNFLGIDLGSAPIFQPGGKAHLLSDNVRLVRADVRDLLRVLPPALQTVQRVHVDFPDVSPGDEERSFMFDAAFLEGLLQSLAPGGDFVLLTPSREVVDQMGLAVGGVTGGRGGKLHIGEAPPQMMHPSLWGRIYGKTYERIYLAQYTRDAGLEEQMEFLVVEDDELILSGLVMSVEMWAQQKGVQVRISTAGNFQQAKALLQERGRAAFHAVLSDGNLGDGTGWDLIAKELNPAGEKPVSAAVISNQVGLDKSLDKKLAVLQGSGQLTIFASKEVEPELLAPVLDALHRRIIVSRQAERNPPSNPPAESPAGLEEAGRIVARLQEFSRAQNLTPAKVGEGAVTIVDLTAEGGELLLPYLPTGVIAIARSRAEAEVKAAQTAPDRPIPEDRVVYLEGQDFFYILRGILRQLPANSDTKVRVLTSRWSRGEVAAFLMSDVLPRNLSVEFTATDLQQIIELLWVGDPARDTLADLLGQAQENWAGLEEWL